MDERVERKLHEQFRKLMTLPEELAPHVKKLRSEDATAVIEAARAIAAKPHPAALGALNSALNYEQRKKLGEQDQRVLKALWNAWLKVVRASVTPG